VTSVREKATKGQHLGQCQADVKTKLAELFEQFENNWKISFEKIKIFSRSFSRQQDEAKNTSNWFKNFFRNEKLRSIQDHLLFIISQ
jgi:hypothetical protein